MSEKKRILVADDERDVRDLLCRILEDSGYAVQAAEDGVQALAVLDKHGADLLILDLMMPEMDGWQVLDHLSVTPRPTRVIVLSAYGDPQRAIAAGAVGCLAKPFRRQQLLDACRGALGGN